MSYKIRVITKLVGSANLLLSYPGSAREGWITGRCQKKKQTTHKTNLQDLECQQSEYTYANLCFREAKNSKAVTGVCRVPVYFKVHGFNMMKSEESVWVNGDHVTLLCRLFSLCCILSARAIDLSISAIHKKKSY